MSIDEFIKIVAPKLRNDVGKMMEEIRGSDLRLTGYKEVKGEPIDDDKIYKIPVPVVRKLNHKHKLRLAWLRGGELAVAAYMRQYMNDADVEKAISVLKNKP